MALSHSESPNSEQRALLARKLARLSYSIGERENGLSAPPAVLQVVPMILKYPLFPLFVSPFRIDDLASMRKGEARKAFEWFVQQSPNRVELLLDGVERDTGVRPNFSERSLILIWKWAIPFFTSCNQPPCGVETDQDGRIPTKCDQGIHIVGLSLTFDIGYYLAEITLREFPEVRWILWDRKTYPRHQPVLSGFKMPFSPRHLVQKAALAVLEGDFDDCQLLNAYQKRIESLAK